MSSGGCLVIFLPIYCISVWVYIYLNMELSTFTGSTGNPSYYAFGIIHEQLKVTGKSIKGHAIYCIPSVILQITVILHQLLPAFPFPSVLFPNYNLSSLYWAQYFPTSSQALEVRASITHLFVFFYKDLYLFKMNCLPIFMKNKIHSSHYKWWCVWKNEKFAFLCIYAFLRMHICVCMREKSMMYIHRLVIQL